MNKTLISQELDFQKSRCRLKGRQLEVVIDFFFRAWIPHKFCHVFGISSTDLVMRKFGCWILNIGSKLLYFRKYGRTVAYFLHDWSKQFFYWSKKAFDQRDFFPQFCAVEKNQARFLIFKFVIIKLADDMPHSHGH